VCPNDEGGDIIEGPVWDRSAQVKELLKISESPRKSSSAKSIKVSRACAFDIMPTNNPKQRW
jgi:hypothetical protein